MKHIFLIDDDVIFNQMHLGHFEKVNFAEKVSVFANSREAFNKLKQLHDSDPKNLPGLIFLDINMPVTDGWKFLDELKTLSASLVDACKVVILTSSISSIDIERAKTYEIVFDFISKPLTSTKLRTLNDKLACEKVA